MEAIKEFESQVTKLLVNQLTNHAPALKEIGVTFSEPEVEIRHSDSSRYESEIRIWFYKNEKFIDVIETHIYREGKPIANLVEFETWFEEEISELIKSNQSS